MDESCDFHLKEISGMFESKGQNVFAEETGAIQELRDKIASKPELCKNTEDKFLLRFLRATKFDKSSAYQLLCNHSEFQRKNRN